jgi:hypothetical protein
MFGGGKERRIGEYKARHVETEPGGANLHMSRFVSHPAGAELGGVRVTADTTKENQWAHTEAGEKPPSVAYESDAVRRLDTTSPPPAGSADGRRRRSGQIGGVCHFKRELTKRAVCEAGRAYGRLPFCTSSRAESGWGRFERTGTPDREAESRGTNGAGGELGEVGSLSKLSSASSSTEKEMRSPAGSENRPFERGKTTTCGWSRAKNHKLLCHYGTFAHGKCDSMAQGREPSCDGETRSVDNQRFARCVIRRQLA